MLSDKHDTCVNAWWCICLSVCVMMCLHVGPLAVLARAPCFRRRWVGAGIRLARGRVGQPLCVGARCRPLATRARKTKQIQAFGCRIRCATDKEAEIRKYIADERSKGTNWTDKLWKKKMNAIAAEHRWGMCQHGGIRKGAAGATPAAGGDDSADGVSKMQKRQLHSRPLAATIRQMRSGRCSRMAKENGHLPEATMPMLQRWPHRWVLTSPHWPLAVQLCHWPLAVHQATWAPGCP